MLQWDYALQHVNGNMNGIFQKQFMQNIVLFGIRSIFPVLVNVVTNSLSPRTKWYFETRRAHDSVSRH